MPFLIDSSEARRPNSSSTKKLPRWIAGKQWEDGQSGMANLIFGTLTSALTYINHKARTQWQTKIEGLEVYLDNLAGLRR